MGPEAGADESSLKLTSLKSNQSEEKLKEAGQDTKYSQSGGEELSAANQLPRRAAQTERGGPRAIPAGWWLVA